MNIQKTEKNIQYTNIQIKETEKKDQTELLINFSLISIRSKTRIIRKIVKRNNHKSAHFLVRIKSSSLIGNFCVSFLNIYKSKTFV